jgi:hypothetical protein
MYHRIHHTKKCLFKINTYEKAMHFIECMRYHKVKDKIEGIYEYYPELKNLKNDTQEYLAELIGCSREAVSRAMKKIKEQNSI